MNSVQRIKDFWLIEEEINLEWLDTPHWQLNHLRYNGSENWARLVIIETMEECLYYRTDGNSCPTTIFADMNAGDQKDKFILEIEKYTAFGLSYSKYFWIGVIGIFNDIGSKYRCT